MNVKVNLSMNVGMVPKDFSYALVLCPSPERHLPVGTWFSSNLVFPSKSPEKAFLPEVRWYIHLWDMDFHTL